MGKMDAIYAASPLWVQNAMVSAYGLYWHWLRFGGSYKHHAQGYRQRENFTNEEWSRYQQAQLAALLGLCADKVPYYRGAWTSSQKQAARRGDLQGLPMLEKEPIRIDPDAFCVEGFHGPVLTFHTSGSTGTPIASKWTISELRNSLALREVRSINWAGASFKQPRATFSGRMVEPNPESEGPYSRFNTVEKQVYFSPFHLRQDTAHFYVEALRKHHIQWMTGYAVSYYLLAKFILAEKLVAPPLKAVVTTSEKLIDEMRTVMEQAYQCRIYEEYSTVENAVFASECEHGRLHVSPDAGMVEILRPDGSACEPGEVGDVVATCLMRSYQPMIRFRLGDMACWDDEPCLCGRYMPVIKEVVGRLEDVVIGPDGRQMVRFHGIFTDQPNVIEAQVIQEAIDLIRVKVVASAHFSQNDVADIENRIHQRMTDKVQVIVEKVDTIPRTKAGKFQAVISKVKDHEQVT